MNEKSTTLSQGTVAAVVVTRNRVEQLDKCIRLLREQTRRVDEIVVVDNASTDGTADLLRRLDGQVSAVMLGENTGASGGFCSGMTEAFENGHQWLWVMDDDSAPTGDALERLLGAELPDDSSPAILSSRVLWRDGRLHPMNRPMPKLDAVAVTESARVGVMPLRAASFVSCLVHRSAIEEYGLPDADYFFWNDDLEYTARVLRRRTGYWVPSSVVYHETPEPHVPLVASVPKFYYEVRNKLYMLRGGSWTVREKLRLARQLGVNVVRFLLRHRMRPDAVGVVARGVRDGLRPRSARR
jgi:rhamnopyranosyl-N-acetylglucosaminyl-diphospho-decaprenol beta-1,3/1,4-galactofuranosyltransferase